MAHFATAPAMRKARSADVVTPFTGTAAYCARYRPPYPDQLLADLRARAGTTGHGTLLDLACGPGRVAIPMAPHFGQVLAIDAEAEMIAVGEAAAQQRGIANVGWRVTRAEDLQLASGSIELITIGEAFHRLDQTRILDQALVWLQPGGALATLGGEPIWRGAERWQGALVDVVNRWTEGALGDPAASPWGGPVDRLRTAGFVVQEDELVVEQTWTCDSIMGFLFSTSIASRPRLGDRAGRLATALRQTLLGIEPRDQFVAKQRFGFTLGRKSDAGIGR